MNAYILTASGSKAAAEELRHALRQRLPEYMVPAAFVFLDALPLTVNGKVDRKALPKPDSLRRQDGNSYIAPRNATETRLAEIWADVLKLESVGIEDSFFELGGHSLSAVRLVAEMERQLGCGVSVALLFKFPTIAQLAIELRPWDSDQRAPILAVQPKGSMPPFFCVHGYAAYGEIARQFRPKWPFYGLGQHFSGRRVTRTRVEDQAKAHLREIYAVQPSGPYYLAGHSIGGLIAYEIALRLRRDGHEVAFLGLIDTVFPRAASAARRRVREGFWSYWGTLTRLSAASRSDRFFESVRASLRWQLKALQCYGYHLIDRSLPADLLTFYVDEVVFRSKYAREQKRYWPRPYAGRVDYFRAAQSLNDVEEWRVFIDGELVFHDIPGTHLTMIEEAGAAELARSLKSCLEQAAAARQRLSSRAA